MSTMFDKKTEDALKAIPREKRTEILNAIGKQLVGKELTCLLYTSDAADD